MQRVIIKWVVMTIIMVACPWISDSKAASNATKQKQLNRAIAFAARLEIYASGLEHRSDVRVGLGDDLEAHEQEIVSELNREKPQFIPMSGAVRVLVAE